MRIGVNDPDFDTKVAAARNAILAKLDAYIGQHRPCHGRVTVHGPTIVEASDLFHIAELARELAEPLACRGTTNA